MAFTSHLTEVVSPVLVAVLHLDHVPCELRFASTHQISLIALPRVACVLRPTHCLRPRRATASLRGCIHVMCPPLTRAARLSIGFAAAKLQRSRMMREGVRQPFRGTAGPAPRMTHIP